MITDRLARRRCAAATDLVSAADHECGQEDFACMKNVERSQEVTRDIDFENGQVFLIFSHQCMMHMFLMMRKLHLEACTPIEYNQRD